MQGAGRPRLRQPAIEIVGGLQRVGVDEDDGVQRGVLLVVRVDARQILRNERVAGQRARAQRRFNLRDGGFVDREWPWGLGFNNNRSSCNSQRRTKSSQPSRQHS